MFNKNKNKKSDANQFYIIIVQDINTNLHTLSSSGDNPKETIMLFIEKIIKAFVRVIFVMKLYE